MIRSRTFLTWLLVAVTLSCLFALTCFAQISPPQDLGDALGWFNPLFQAFTGHDWSVVAGIVVILFVSAVDYIVMPRWGLTHPAWKVAAAAILPVVVAVAGGLYAHIPLGPAVKAALFTGTASSGLFTWLKALILGGSDAAPPALPLADKA